MALGVLTQEQYSLILGGAVLSIALNSFVFKLAGPLEQAVRRVPGLAAVFDRHMRRPEPPAEDALEGHVVVVGYGSAGRSVTDVLTTLNVPCLVVERELSAAEEAEGRRAGGARGRCRQLPYFWSTRILSGRGCW